MMSHSRESISLELRRYQELIFEHAKDTNTIAFLPTGTGKTLIACYLIGHRIQSIRRERENRSITWKKVAVFIAPTKALLNQQLDYIVRQCSEQVEAIALNGDKTHEGVQIEYWQSEQWLYYFDHYEVLGMTPELLRNLVEKSILPDDVIDVIVIDECHHVVSGNHPMGRLCDVLQLKGFQPLILGLTASPLTTKKTKILEVYASIQERMNATIFVPSEEVMESLKQYSTTAKVLVVEYKGGDIPLVAMGNSFLRQAWSLQTFVKASFFYGMKSLMSQYLPNQFQDLLGDRQALQCVRKLNTLITDIGQVETVHNDCGVYCGLLALIVCLNDARSLSAALEQSNLDNLQAQHNSIDEQVLVNELRAFNEFVAALTVESCQILKYQRYCTVKVLLGLVKRIVGQLFAGAEQQLTDLSYSFLVANADDINECITWFIHGVMDLVEGTVNREEEIIMINTSDMRLFLSTLQFFLLHLLQHVDIDPLLNQLFMGQGQSPAVFSTRSMLSDKMFRLIQLLVSFIRNSNGDALATTEQIFYNIPNIHTVVDFAISPSSPLSFSPPRIRNGQGKSSVIVFCKMRITVQVLHQLIERLHTRYTERSDEFSPLGYASFPLKAAHITGNQNETDQNIALKRLKQREINILFATEVVEEGVDIKSCNMVVNYDGPGTAKSYIQRKGRARVTNAHIVHMIVAPYRKQKDYEDLIRFMLQEKEATEEVHRCLQLLQTFSAQSHSDRYVVPHTRASVDGTAAFSIVHEYCTMLQVISSRHVSPYYMFERQVIMIDDNKKRILFKCNLHLPVLPHSSSSFTYETFPSEFEKSKRQAKSMCCLAAVGYLHKAGQLDDHLRLNRPEREVRVVRKAAPIDQARVEKTLIKSVPDSLTVSNTDALTGSSVQMFMYKMEVQVDWEALSSLPFITQEAVKAFQRLGIALLTPLPDEVTGYQNFIFPHSNLAISYRYVPYCDHLPRLLDKNQLYEMMRFHRAVCNLQADSTADLDAYIATEDFTLSSIDCEKLLKQWSVSSNGSFYIFFPVLPGRHLSIAEEVEYWNECSMKAHGLVHNLNVNAHNTYSELMTRDFVPMITLAQHLEENNAIEGGGLLVTSTGRNLFLYSPNEVDEQHRTLSDISHKHLSYSKYYAKKSPYFEAVINSLMQSSNGAHCLFKAKELSGKMTLIDLFELSNTNKIEQADLEEDEEIVEPASSAKNNDAKYIVAELCQVVGQSDWYFMSLVLPCLAQRLHTLLLATEARTYLNSLLPEGGLEEMALRNVLESLTPRRAKESYSNERLEFFGDTTLKFLVCLDVFAHFPEADQEVLTNLKQGKINNAFLSKLAVQHRLYPYLRAVELSIGLEKVLLTPPGCLPPSPALSASPLPFTLRNVNLKDKKSILANKKISAAQSTSQYVEMSLSSKSLADMVEAVIGAVYTHTLSIHTTSQLLHRLGICQASYEIIRGSTLPALLNTLLAAYTPLLSHREVQEVQGKVHYTFHRPALLSLALTRRSKDMLYNYERLEFLGDAVLDLIVVEELLNRGIETEGELTREKCNHVNNQNFARLAQTLGLPKYIRHEEMSLHSFFNPELANTEEEGGEGLVGQGCKALSDVLEAIVGAVFLDCGMDLEIVRGVIRYINVI